MGRGRAPCCDKSKVKKGPWSPAEDLRLTTFIQKHGHTNWRALPKLAGLLRCGKSCRLRWINYLRPDVKRGNFTPQEELTIINLHNSFGNKWSKIASYLPGRTDNEIKNVWNTHLKKRITAKNSLVDHHHCHQSEAKDSKTNYSTSPSCTSSSITSAGEHKVDIALGHPGEPNEKPEFLKIKSMHDKENSACDSPTSSHASDISNKPNKALEFSDMNPAEDDGKIEIPVGSDIDFWELFGSLQGDGPLPSAKTEEINEQAGSIEGSMWLRFLEDELGLTSDVDQTWPKDQNIVPTTPHEYEEMNLGPEIGPGFDYFPIWPSSPENLGI